MAESASPSGPAKLPAYAPTLLAYHRAFERELRGLIAGLPLRRGDRVLDLACGDGVYARWLAERLGSSGRVVAVDRSAAFFVLARREVRDEFERLVDPGSPAYLLDNPDFTATCLNHPAWSVKRGG
jgi:SAM-dependent methyltransferase